MDSDCHGNNVICNTKELYCDCMDGYSDLNGTGCIQGMFVTEGT